MIELTESEIDYARWIHAVRSHKAGALVTFLGTTRQFTRDRETDSLDYQAYPDMAERKLEQIEAEARERWPIVHLAIIHRLGRMELGDISVAIAVSCPHRAQAFEACQWIMDTIKEVVPIWKKENWADGESEWVHPGLESVPEQARPRDS